MVAGFDAADTPVAVAVVYGKTFLPWVGVRGVAVAEGAEVRVVCLVEPTGVLGSVMKLQAFLGAIGGSRTSLNSMTKLKPR